MLVSLQPATGSHRSTITDGYLIVLREIAPNTIFSRVGAIFQILGSLGVAYPSTHDIDFTSQQSCRANKIYVLAVNFAWVRNFMHVACMTATVTARVPWLGYRRTSDVQVCSCEHRPAQENTSVNGSVRRKILRLTGIRAVGGKI
jgi:hypothetical protein